MMIPGHKAKVKSRISIRTLNKNHMINVIHMIHVILGNSLDEIIIDQKIIFSLKNMNIAEKIIFVLDVTIQIIQLKTANICLTQIECL